MITASHNPYQWNGISQSELRQLGIAIVLAQNRDDLDVCGFRKRPAATAAKISFQL